MIREASATVPPGNFLCRWEPRVKLLGMCCLIFVFAAVNDTWLLPLVLGCALLFYALSSLPWSYLAHRMRLPGLFLLAVILMLPFLSGDTVLVQLGPLAIKQEGTIAAVMIAVKFFSIITVATVLFASMPMTGLVGAMSALGLPGLLADMLLFTHRYIYQLAADFQRAATAARLRGARLRSLRSLRTTAYIVGSLLVSSHARAERVFQAMTLRGYGSRGFVIRKNSPGAADLLALSACVAFAAGLVLLQLLAF